MNAERLLQHYEQIADAPDAIARLRRFILDLAVRGKLVPQDPADEPASELLKRIADVKSLSTRKERTKKQAEGLLKDAADIPLPAGWASAPFSDLVAVINGRAYKQQELLSAGVPVLRVGNLFTSDNWYYSDLSLPEDKYCDKGDLIFAWSASFGPFIWSGGRVIYHYHIWKLVLHSEADLSKLYLYNFLLHKTREIKDAGHGISMIHMTKEKMEQLSVPLPPLAEQHRIVAKVDELMALCDELEAARTERETKRDRLAAASLARLNAPDPETFRDDAHFALDALPALTARPDQIKQLRQTILNLAVRGKLVPQEPTDEPAVKYLAAFTDLPAKARKFLKPLTMDDCALVLPETWSWLPLGAMIRSMDAGWSPQCENHPRKSEEEWAVLKTTAVQALSFDADQNKLLPSKLVPRPQFEAQIGDILVTRAGPKNRVGVSCVVDVPCPRLMISDKLIRFHPVGELSARYLALTLNAGHSFQRLEDAKSGMAVMQMNISQDKLQAIPIPLPPLAEQHRIVAKVDELMALCDQLETSLTSADETRKKLLDALLAEALKPVDIEVLQEAAE